MNRFIPHKKQIPAFISLYLVLVIVSAIISGSFVVRPCPGCAMSWTFTISYYLLSIILVYLVFMWANHIWKKIKK